MESEIRMGGNPLHQTFQSCRSHRCLFSLLRSALCSQFCGFTRKRLALFRGLFGNFVG
ncbi:MAG: hypothetical protein IPH54_23290 [Rhodoferax sp.]|nr:hypothetical protein [Rhodoferax sp.]